MAAPWEDYKAQGATSAPWEDYQAQAPAAPKKDAKPEEQSHLTTVGAALGKATGNAVLGGQKLLGMGIKRLGGDRAGQWLINDANEGNARLAGETKQYKDANPLTFGASELAGDVIATLPVGGVLAKGVSKAAPTLLKVAPGMESGINAFSNALRTGGMTTGVKVAPGALPFARNMAIRTAAAAATSGTAAALLNPEDAGTGALIGGVLPGATKLLGVTGRGIRNSITGGGVGPEVAALAARAKELGINIPADRLVNSRPLNAAASALNYIPFSGRAATEDAMTSQLNQALSKTFGQNSSNVTQALRKAEDVLGGEFDRVLKNNTVKVDQQFFSEIADIGNTAAKELGSDGLRPVMSQIDEIMAKGANGQIDGQAAYNIKRTLDRLGRGNGPEAYHANELRSSLMSALNRSIGPEKAAAFAKTREQYGSMLSLKKLAKNGAEGEISVARLANMGNIRNPQMQELADISAQFVKSREGAHGGAQRAVVGTAAALTGGLPGLLAGATAGRGGNMLLNSNTARNFVMRQQGLLAEPETLGLLGQGAYRTLPLLPSQSGRQ